MKFETYNRNENFVRKLTPATGTQIVTVWEPSETNIEAALIPIAQHVIQNGFINSLRIMTRVTSIPPVNIPLLDAEQSRSERLGLVRDMEWTQPRKHVVLHLKSSNGIWVKVATISIQNIPPFRMYDLLEYFTQDVAIPLGADGGIGISIENGGYGLLQDEDEITVFGMTTTEVVVIPEEVEPIKQSQNYGEIIDNNSSVFIGLIPNKKQVTLTNAGNSDIFLSLGKPAELNKGICLRANGGSYEFNRSNHPFDLEIHAIATEPSLLTGIVAI